MAEAAAALEVVDLIGTAKPQALVCQIDGRDVLSYFTAAVRPAQFGRRQAWTWLSILRPPASISGKISSSRTQAPLSRQIA